MSKLTFIFILLIINLLGCVTIQPLSGGPEDADSPILVKTLNKNNNLVLVFNENITLANQNEIISNIYPSPKYEVSRNKLIIKDIPSNDRKHLIHFNNSIQDLNANNPLQKYIYANNVGADTFAYSGSVAYLLSKKEDYTNCYVVITDKPFQVIKAEDLYNFDFTKTDKEGDFQLSYIPNPKNKTLFCFLDNNNNTIPDSGDYVGRSSTTIDSIKEPILITYYGNNLIYTDTILKGTQKLVYKNINYKLINSNPREKIKKQVDTLFNFTNTQDTTILQKINNVIEKEKIKVLSKGSTFPITKFPNNYVSFDFNLKHDSNHPFLGTNNNTLFYLNIKPLSTASSIKITNLNANMRGVLFNTDHIFYINNQSYKFTLPAGKYNLILYEDLNANQSFDVPRFLFNEVIDRVIYNAKVIDISPKMDVEISAQP